MHSDDEYGPALPLSIIGGVAENIEESIPNWGRVIAAAYDPEAAGAVAEIINAAMARDAKTLAGDAGYSVAVGPYLGTLLLWAVRETDGKRISMTRDQYDQLVNRHQN